MLGCMSTPIPSSTNKPRFTEEKQKRLREIFAPIAQKYRSRSRLALVVLGLVAVIILIAILMKTFNAWIGGAFFICWLIMGVVVITQSSLKCPACRGNLVSEEFGSFCPECGAASLKLGGWFKSAHCDSCGKSLGRGRTRQYRVRACTHCGLILDERGL